MHALLHENFAMRCFVLTAQFGVASRKGSGVNGLRVRLLVAVTLIGVLLGIGLLVQAVNSPAFTAAAFIGVICGIAFGLPKLNRTLPKVGEENQRWHVFRGSNWVMLMVFVGVLLLRYAEVISTPWDTVWFLALGVAVGVVAVISAVINVRR
jgi:F0F1-type ATP synthase assembly protein I